jgi:chromosome segregation ATPase
VTAEQPSVEALETLRHYLNGHKRIVDGPDGSFTSETPPSVKPALAALDSLTAALERAERERDENDAKRVEAWQQLQVAEARIQTLENEREALLRGEVRDQLEARAQKADAVVEWARKFADSTDYHSWTDERHPRIAPELDALLAAYDEPPTEQIPGAGQDGC